MKRYIYSRSKLIPLLFLLPQLIITVLFFIWPSFSAFWESIHQGDPFGIQTSLVWFENFLYIFSSSSYYTSVLVTIAFSFTVAILTLLIGLCLALFVISIKRFSGIYKTLLIWPYAVAPVVAAVLFSFLLNPAIGIVTYVFNNFGISWNYHLDRMDAFFIIVITAVWQQISYNFIFFLVGLKSIPDSILEAASIDGASLFNRFIRITLPLLSPTIFFLFIMNLIYAFFDTFGVIHIITHGGPANYTNILVYKVFNDGFVGLDLGGSAAQSVLLMIIVSIFTLVQFKYIERKVHYS